MTNYATRLLVASGTLFAILATTPGAYAQTNAGGWLKRTASAVLGLPAQPAPPTAISVDQASGLVTGPTTTGEVFRPISPAHGEFEGIFNNYSIAQNSPRGHYPRVALTAEVYGGSIPCWTFKATIWQTPASHHDQRFELCNAPMTTKDDLGAPVEVEDPTFALMSVITGHHTMPSTSVHVTSERTTGPDPADMPFAIQVDMTTTAGKALVSQYDHMIARAMLVSAYAPRSQMLTGNGLRQAGTVASDGRLMWFAGFAPGGNRDTPANPSER